MPGNSKDVNLRFVVEAVDKAGNKLKAIAQDFNKIEKEANETLNATKKLGSEGAKALSQMETSTSKLEAGFKRLSSAGDTLVNLGTQLGLVGAAIAGAAIFPVAKAASFEKAMSGVLAVTANAEEQFSALSGTAQEFGRTTKFTATEAAEGMRFLGMAGFSAQEVIEGIGPSLQLAAAGGLELADAADIASNVVQGFQLQISDLGHVTDVLANTATSSNTSVYQLAEAMKYAAPAAAAAGVSIEEASAVLGVLGNNGIQASMAGTTLRGMLASLVAPTNKAKEAMDKLGVEVVKNEDGSINLIETLKALANANMGLAEANDIFRRQAAAGALAVGKQAAEVDKLTQANIRAEGAAKKMAEIMQENLLGSLTKLSSAFEGLMIAVGEPLLAPLRSVVDAVTSAVTAFAEWAKEHQTLSKVVVATAGSFGVLLASVGALAIPAGLAMKAFGTLGEAMVRMGNIIPVLATKMKSLNVVLKASPVAVIGTLILGSVVAAYKIWGEEATRLAAKLGDQEKAQTATIKSLESYSSKLDELFLKQTKGEKVGKEYVSVIDEMKRKFPELADELRAASDAWYSNSKAIEAAVAQEKLDRLKTLVDRVAALKGAAEEAQFLEGVFVAIQNVFKGFVEGLGNGLELLGMLFEVAFKTIGDKVGSVLDYLGGKLASFLRTLAEVADYMPWFGDDIKATFNSMADGAENSFAGMGKSVRETMSGIGETLGKAKQNVVDYYTTLGKGSPEGNAKLKEIDATLVEIARSYDELRKSAGYSIEEIIADMKNLGATDDQINKVIDKLEEWDKKEADKLAKTKDRTKGEVDAHSKMADGIVAAHSKMADELKSIEQSIADHKSAMSRVGMTDAQKIMDDKRLAMQALANAEKAMASATTASQKEEALKQYQNALQMFQQLELAAKQHEEKIRAEKQKTTTVSKAEKDKQVADAKSAEDQAYNAMMEALQRETNNQAQENQRRRDAEEAEIAWMEARAKTTAANDLKTTEDANKKKVESTSNTYKQIGSEVSAALAKIATAVEALTEKVSKPLEVKADTADVDTKLKNSETTANDTKTAIESPSKTTTDTSQSDTALDGLKTKADAAKAAMETPAKVTVDTSQPDQAMPGLDQEAQEMRRNVEKEAKVQFDISQAEESLRKMDEDIAETKRQAEEPKQYIMDDAGVTTSLEKIGDGVKRTKEVIVEGKTYNVEVTWAEAELMRLNKAGDDIKQKITEDKKYAMDPGGAKADLEELTRRANVLSKEITTDKELGIKTDVALTQVGELKTKLSKIDTEIAKQRTLTVDFKGTGSSESGLSDKITEMTTLLGTFSTNLEGQHVFSVDFTAAKADLNELVAKIDELIPKLSEKREFVLELGTAKQDVEDLLTAVTTLQETVEAGATFTLTVDGREDIEATLKAAQDIAAQDWDTTSTVTVEGASDVESLLSQLQAVSKAWDSTHTVTVVGLDDLRKALAYHTALDGLHTTSYHNVEVTGEGSAKRPISEKIREVEGMFADLGNKLSKHSKHTIDFVGTGSGEKPISGEFDFIVKLMASLDKEVEKKHEWSIDTSTAMDKLGELQKGIVALPHQGSLLLGMRFGGEVPWWEKAGGSGTEWVSKFTGGGSLSGYGGGDTVPAMLERGEFVIRKEAVRDYGAGLFDMMNRRLLKFAGGGSVAVSPRIPLVGVPPSPTMLSARAVGTAVGRTLVRQRFQTGGSVEGMDVKDLGKLDLQIGGNGYPVLVKPSVAKELELMLRRERLTTVG